MTASVTGRGGREPGAGRRSGRSAGPWPSLPSHTVQAVCLSSLLLSECRLLGGCVQALSPPANPPAKREMFYTPQSPKRHLSVIKVVTNGNKNEGYIL